MSSQLSIHYKSILHISIFVNRVLNIRKGHLSPWRILALKSVSFMGDYGWDTCLLVLFVLVILLFTASFLRSLRALESVASVVVVVNKEPVTTPQQRYQSLPLPGSFVQLLATLSTRVSLEQLPFNELSLCRFCQELVDPFSSFRLFFDV